MTKTKTRKPKYEIINPEAPKLESLRRAVVKIAKKLGVSDPKKHTISPLQEDGVDMSLVAKELSSDEFYAIAYFLAFTPEQMGDQRFLVMRTKKSSVKGKKGRKS